MDNPLLILLAPFRDELLQSFRAIVREEIAAVANNAKPTKQDQYLNKAQTADLLGINVRTVDAWMKDGKLKAHRIGRRVRFKLGEIDQALKAIKTN